jgi:hypothetical protein
MKERNAQDKNNEARKIYDEAVAQNNLEIKEAQDQLYKENPVLLIHRITPGALSEADLLKLHHLNKEERKLKRKELIDSYKIELLRRFESGDLSQEELIDLVK